jgi:hypothetical protein
MKKSYFNAPLSWRIVGLAMLFSVLAGNSLLAQVSAYVFTSSTGVYTPLVGGTVLGTATNDDNNFGSFPLGFTFWYNGAPLHRGSNPKQWMDLIRPNPSKFLHTPQHGPLRTMWSPVAHTTCKIKLVGNCRMQQLAQHPTGHLWLSTKTTVTIWQWATR